MTKRPFDDGSLTKKITSLNKKAIASSHVVDLNQYREVANTPNKTILIVDDEAMVRNSLKKIFERDCYHVVTAKDAIELSKIIENTRLDLILLDVQLPWVDGYEICALIKNNPAYKNLPIAIISGNQNKDEIKKGFDAGCDEYILKPFKMDDVHNVVTKLLLKYS